MNSSHCRPTVVPLFEKRNPEQSFITVSLSYLSHLDLQERLEKRSSGGKEGIRTELVSQSDISAESFISHTGTASGTWAGTSETALVSARTNHEARS